MEKYDYKATEKQDILDYIKYEIDFADFDSLEELEENLNDDLWIDDSVTGNGSGTYTYNLPRETVTEMVLQNWKLLCEAMLEFEVPFEKLEELEDNPDYFDTTIRCYLLEECIAEVLEEIKPDFEAAQREKDEKEENAI